MTDDQAKRLDIGAWMTTVLAGLIRNAPRVDGVVRIGITENLADLIAAKHAEWHSTFPKDKSESQR